MAHRAKKTLSAGGVVLNRFGEILLVDQFGSSWSLPKGHIENGESPVQAARREIMEESGVTELTYVTELGEYERFRMDEHGRDDFNELKTIVLFLFTTSETDLAPRDANNKAARWVARHHVVELLTHKKDREFFLSILDKLA